MTQYVDAVYEQLGKTNMPMSRYLAYTILNRETLDKIAELPPTLKTML
jgi:hypothetical protein